MTHASKHSSAKQLKAMHTPQAIRDRLEEGPREGFLGDFVFGAIDGTVTTFAVVAGVEGAGLAAGIIVVLGLANLLGDGFSMAVGNYLGKRSEEQLLERYRRIEEDHIDRHPEGEKEEIRQIFAMKGFEGDTLEQAVEIITAEKQRWVDTMLVHEWGVTPQGGNAVKAAWVTFFAFVTVGTLPLAAFGWQLIVPENLALPNAFLVSSIMTGVAFFVVGAMKSRVTEENWMRAGTLTLLMGGTAAALAYAVGALLTGLV